MQGLTTVGSSGLAVNDARLLARIIETQNDVAAVEMHVPLVMQMIVDRTAALVGADGAVVELVDGADMVYHAASGMAQGYVGMRLKVSTSFSGGCYLSGQSAICTDAFSDPRVDQAAAKRVGIRSMLVVPLPHGGKVLGVLKVVSRQVAAFSERDVMALQMMAGLCAAALTHASEFEIKQRLLQERTDALAALRKSEQEFRTIFELAGIGKAQLCLETGKIVRVNSSLCEMLGYPLDEMVGMQLSLFTHPEDLVHSISIAAAMKAGKTSKVTFEKRYVRKDGSVLWALVNAAALTDRTGKPTRTVTTIQDITERKLAEHLERDRRRVLERVAQNAGLGEVLDGLSEAVQHQIDGAIAAVFVLDEGRMRLHGTACPREWIRELRSQAFRLAPALAAGCEQGADSCGVSDMLRGPEWESLREFAKVLRLATCWTLRIFANDGSVLGLLCVGTPRTCGPTQPELRNLVLIANLATVCLENHGATRQLTHLVRHDVLTGLPNRFMLAEVAREALAAASEAKTFVAMFVLDVDRFKSINDTLGHHVGDELLQRFGGRMREVLRPQDTLGRCGGDEFVAILPALKSRDEAYKIANEFLAELETPFEIASRSLVVTSSIGIAFYPDDASEPGMLQAKADEALYRAKRAGRARWSI